MFFASATVPFNLSDEIELVETTLIHNDKPHRSPSFGGALLDEQFLLGVGYGLAKASDLACPKAMAGVDSTYPDCAAYFVPAKLADAARDWARRQAHAWVLGEECVLPRASSGFQIGLRATRSGLWVLLYNLTEDASYTDDMHEFFKGAFPVAQLDDDARRMPRGAWVAVDNEESSGAGFFSFFQDAYPLAWRAMQAEGLFDSECAALDGGEDDEDDGS